jgi:hypothetical protein
MKMTIPVAAVALTGFLSLGHASAAGQSGAPSYERAISCSGALNARLQLATGLNDQTYSAYMHDAQGFGPRVFPLIPPHDRDTWIKKVDAAADDWLVRSRAGGRDDPQARAWLQPYVRACGQAFDYTVE